MGIVNQCIRMCNKRRVAITFLMCVTIQAVSLLHNKFKQLLHKRFEFRQSDAGYDDSILTGYGILPYLITSIVH